MSLLQDFQQFDDVRIQTRRDTSANWTEANPVLLAGEEILVDTGNGELRRKIGDGVKTYTQLPFTDEKLRSMISDLNINMKNGTGENSLVGNDIDDNQAISAYSTALGQGTTAGSKGFRINNIDHNAKTITLEGYADYVAEHPDKVFAIDDIYTMRLNDNYDKRGTITAINGDVITVTKLPTEGLVPEHRYYIKGAWMWNSTLTKDGFVSQEINFTSNGYQYNGIGETFKSPDDYFGSYSPEYAPGPCMGYITNENGFIYYVYNFNNSYWWFKNRTIDFGDTDQEISKDFYDYVLANSTPQDGGELSVIDIVGDMNTFRVIEKPLVGNIDVAVVAVATGIETKAVGSFSFAEGYATEAYGKYSHAEGRETKAGYAAHAEGEGTVATKANQHVQGKYNLLDNDGNSGNFAHIIGGGTSDNNRKNIHTVDWNGNAWYAGDVIVGQNNDKLATEKYVDDGLKNVNLSSGEGNNSIVGNDVNNNIADGNYSVALGEGSKSYAESGMSMGYHNMVAAIDKDAHINFNLTPVDEDENVIEEKEGATASCIKITIADESKALFDSKTGDEYLHFFLRYHTRIEGDVYKYVYVDKRLQKKEFSATTYDYVLKLDKIWETTDKDKQGVYHFYKNDLFAGFYPNDYNTDGTTADPYIGATAMGYFNVAANKGAMAGGYFNVASNNAAIALGYKNTADGDGAVALGAGNKALQDRAFAGGQESIASGHTAVALGYKTNARARQSTALGTQTTTGCYGYKIASYNKARNSVTVTEDTQYDFDDVINFKIDNGEDERKYLVHEGQYEPNSNEAWSTRHADKGAIISYSFDLNELLDISIIYLTLTVGRQYEIRWDVTNNKITENLSRDEIISNSLFIDNNTTIPGNTSPVPYEHVYEIELNNKKTGYLNIYILDSIPDGGYGGALKIGSNFKLSKSNYVPPYEIGERAIVRLEDNYYNYPIKDIKIGLNTVEYILDKNQIFEDESGIINTELAKKDDYYSIRVASKPNAGTVLLSGRSALATGEQTWALGDYSSANGYLTVAAEKYAHAEGYGTQASGDAAHAEGYQTIARGAYSHASGNNTEAFGANQTVIGKWNKIDTENKYAFIVGNGTWTENGRSNAFAVKWDGTLECKLPNAHFYDTLSAAITDINNSTTDNALMQGKVVVFIATNGARTVMLIDDVAEAEAITINKDIHLVLAGHTLSFGAIADGLIFAENTDCAIDGSVLGSCIRKDVAITGTVTLIRANGAKLVINGGEYALTEQTGIALTIRHDGTGEFEACDAKIICSTTADAVRAKAVQSTAEKAVFKNCSIMATGSKSLWTLASGSTKTLVTNCAVDATSLIDRAEVRAISSVLGTNASTFIVEKTKITAVSRYLALSVENSSYCQMHVSDSTIMADAPNGAGGNSARACGINNFGKLFCKNTNVTGTHSGLSNNKELYVSGGIFTGTIHGGFYLSHGADGIAYIRDATIRCGEYFGQFTDFWDNIMTNISSTPYNFGAMYIGGGAAENNNNITVYIDGCVINDTYYETEERKTSWAMVLRGTNGETGHIVNISNSQCAGRFRLDNSTMRLNVGAGTNITDDMLTYGSAAQYTVFTNELYRKHHESEDLNGKDFSTLTFSSGNLGNSITIGSTTITEDQLKKLLTLLDYTEYTGGTV